MLLSLAASLRDRHPLAPIAVALLGQHIFPIHFTPRLAGVGAIWLAVPCMALWLIGCVTWVYLFGTHSGTSRVRVRDVEDAEELVTLRFPSRRLPAARDTEGWTPTEWSADDIAPWTPQRDQR